MDPEGQETNDSSRELAPAACLERVGEERPVMPRISELRVQKARKGRCHRMSLPGRKGYCSEEGWVILRVPQLLCVHELAAQLMQTLKLQSPVLITNEFMLMINGLRMET